MPTSRLRPDRKHYKPKKSENMNSVLQQQQAQAMQQRFVQEVSLELEEMTMPWNEELREWYDTAINTIDSTSSQSLMIPQERFADLMLKSEEGLIMTTVQVLCNAVIAKAPNEMAMTKEEWGEFLKLNKKIANRWHEFAQPVQDKVNKRLQILGMPNNNGLMKVHGKA